MTAPLTQSLKRTFPGPIDADAVWDSEAALQAAVAQAIAFAGIVPNPFYPGQVCVVKGAEQNRLFTLRGPSLTLQEMAAGGTGGSTPAPFTGIFGRRVRGLDSVFGLFFSPGELAAWRARAESGPFLVNDDAGTGFPGDWTRIANNTADFIANPTASRQGARPETWDPVFTAHIRLVEAAFYNLLFPSDELGDLIRAELWWQLVTAGFRYQRTDDFGPSDSGTNHWGMVSWLTRLLMAYDFSKALFSPVEQSTLKAWFQDAAWMFALNAHRDLVANFPNRLSRDYSVRASAAGDTRNLLVGQTADVAFRGYTHRDASGLPVNRIPRIAAFYNNRRASGAEFYGLVGILTGDDALLEYAKLYIEEWVRFSVFPDGMTGEYERSSDYGHASSGLFYNGINLQAAVLVADALARKGDFSLYDFATGDGIGDTRGGWKSIKTALDAQTAIVSGSVARYSGDLVTSIPDPTDFVAAANRIGSLTSGGIYSVQYGIQDCWSAVVANKWYQDTAILQSYMRQAPGSTPINRSILAPAGPIGNPWGGSGHDFPSIPFMFAQLEAVRPYPARTISAMQILTDGSGYAFVDSAGHILSIGA